MLPYNDPETLKLLIDQRREELRRAFADSRRLAAAARRSTRLARLSLRAVRLRPSRRPV